MTTRPCPCPPGRCPAPEPKWRGDLRAYNAALARRVAHLEQLGLVVIEREKSLVGQPPSC
ncbi:MAG TPA: hypothetical protein VFU47_02375 [Armatimonadota bacterium]|nr:hypothetical protein [Armatimonadota bacterium]